MVKKWLNRRQSTNIEDRREPRDINKPVKMLSDPTTIDRGKMTMDRFNAQTSVAPLQQYKPKRRMR